MKATAKAVQSIAALIIADHAIMASKGWLTSRGLGSAQVWHFTNLSAPLSRVSSHGGNASAVDLLDAVRSTQKRPATPGYSVPGSRRPDVRLTVTMRERVVALVNASGKLAVELVRPVGVGQGYAVRLLVEPTPASIELVTVDTDELEPVATPMVELVVEAGRTRLTQWLGLVMAMSFQTKAEGAQAIGVSRMALHRLMVGDRALSDHMAALLVIWGAQVGSPSVATLREWEVQPPARSAATMS